MSNFEIDSIPAHYGLPPELWERPGREMTYDTAHWVVQEKFFLGSAIKYVFRGWDKPEHVAKAINSLRLHCLEAASVGIGGIDDGVNDELVEDVDFYQSQVMPSQFSGKWKVLRMLGVRDFLDATRAMERRLAELKRIEGDVRHGRVTPKK